MHKFAELKKVAAWLGSKNQYTPHLQRLGMYFTVTGTCGQVAMSSADLFCAIDDKCAADELNPLLDISFDGTRIYELRPDAQVSKYSGEGPDRLTAALNAVLNLLEAK